jgi:hypothetical protein
VPLRPLPIAKRQVGASEVSFLGVATHVILPADDDADFGPRPQQDEKALDRRSYELLLRCCLVLLAELTVFSLLRTCRYRYGGALLPGEGEAIAGFVQAGKRIPRRGTNCFPLAALPCLAWRPNDPTLHRLLLYSAR